MSRSHCLACKADRDDRDLSPLGLCMSCKPSATPPGRPIHHATDVDRYLVEMIRMANSRPASPALAPQRRSIKQLRKELAHAKATGEMDWNDLEDVATEILEHYDDLMLATNLSSRKGS